MERIENVTIPRMIVESTMDEADANKRQHDIDLNRAIGNLRGLLVYLAISHMRKALHQAESETTKNRVKFS